MTVASSSADELLIVGGSYKEQCLCPPWTEIYGSAGRAASACAALGASVRLVTLADPQVKAVLDSRSALETFGLLATMIDRSIVFDYDHGLATPRILHARQRHETLAVDGERVLRFGMLESDAIVHARSAVYDPQSAVAPTTFGENGSTAERLAVVLNRDEAGLMAGSVPDPLALAQRVQAKNSADVVVLKMGAAGALVLDGSRSDHIPAYRSERVWKIGSGDTFAATFATYWLCHGASAVSAADAASKATSYYCATQGFVTSTTLTQYSADPIVPSARFREGWKPLVYLAGPFFTMAQLWMVTQARNDLLAAGLRVFSPYHDVGHGSAEDVAEADLRGLRDADIVFAIGDGMDSGTLFEVGWARHCGKPVVFYCENESDEAKKMPLGSGCQLVTDYVTAVYAALWTACEL